MVRSSLISPLREWASRTPDQPALLSQGQRDCSYAELVELVDRTSQELASFGVAPTSRVAIILPNAPETATAILSVASTAAVVPLNPAMPAPEMARVLEAAGITHAIAAPDTASHVSDIVRHGGRTLIALSARADGPAGAFDLSVDGPSRSQSVAQAVESADRVALVLQTSGSTGLPKRVPLTVGNLAASAWNVGRSIELTPADRCLNMMPMFHIGALVDLLLAPLYAGGSVAFAHAISSAAFFDGAARFRPTWFQAVPTVLRDILSHKRLEAIPVGWSDNLRLIRAVSQPLPTMLHRQVENELGVTVVPMFGMTETAGLIASAPLDRSERRPGSVGQPFGARIRIVDGLGNEMPTGRNGEVVVSGPNVMSGYEDTHRPESFRGEWLRTGDEGHLDADGHLFLTGRIKDVINRGGEKISPLEIDLLLADHPAVKEAAAFALPHPTLGEDVAVAVVPLAGERLDEAAVTAYLRPLVADHKLPHRVIFLDELPRVPSGKLDRLSLPALAGALAAGRPRTPPQTPTAMAIAGIWSRQLDVADIALEDDFFDLGGDSLRALDLVHELETRFGRELPTTELFDVPTLDGMARLIDVHVKAQTNAVGPGIDEQIKLAIRRATAAWRGKRQSADALIVGRNTVGSRRPFFWVSQSLHGFDALTGAFNPDRPFYVMCSLSPTRLKSDENTRRLAHIYADEIEAIEPDRPVLLGGFCQGGVVAFEIAKVLRARGRAVDILCLQDRFIAEPYEGRVAFFWGKRGWFSAYYLNDHPERGWGKFYSGPVSVNHSSADHWDLHNPGYVDEFVTQLEAELYDIETGSSLRGRTLPRLAPLDPRSFGSRVRASVPLFMRQGSEHIVSVKVKNSSPVTWDATERSGIILAARWCRFRNVLDPFLLDGRRALDRAIAPGETAVIDLLVRVPMHGLPMRLEIDLVEDGMQWFAPYGGYMARNLVIPLPPR